MQGALFGSTKSASSHTQHPTGHVVIMAMVLSSPVNHRFAASNTARQQDRQKKRAHTSGGLVHARHGAFQELRRWSMTRGSGRPPCRRRPHLRAVQAMQPRVMPWQANSRRTVKSMMASRVGSSCGRVNEAGRSLITWRQFGREGGSRVLQGQLTGWCNSRVRCRIPGSSGQAWLGRTEACYARLEDRPLGVWFGEGLKEEITGGQGPWRSSQRPHDEKLWGHLFD
eukprot:scaffold68906_cov63-Phaeocystis_antarctica.AAC.1